MYGFALSLRKEKAFFGAVEKVQAALQEPVTDEKLLTLCIQLRSETVPEALLENIVKTLQDRFLGLEPLALASIVESSAHVPALGNLPNIPGIAETLHTKCELTRAWLRCWQSSGFLIKAMPTDWLNRKQSEGISIRERKGKFKAMEKVLKNRNALGLFNKEWLPELLRIFTQPVGAHLKHLRGSELSLSLDGSWTRCLNCKSVHRPVSGSGTLSRLWKRENHYARSGC